MRINPSVCLLRTHAQVLKESLTCLYHDAKYSSGVILMNIVISILTADTSKALRHMAVQAALTPHSQTVSLETALGVGEILARWVQCWGGCPQQLGGCKHMNRSCGQEEYQVHLYAPRAQLLHLNPSHWNSRLQFHPASVRTGTASRAPPATGTKTGHIPALPPLVSTYYFFSNSSFILKLFSDVCKIPS